MQRRKHKLTIIRLSISKAFSEKSFTYYNAHMRETNNSSQTTQAAAPGKSTSGSLQRSFIVVDVNKRGNKNKQNCLYFHNFSKSANGTNIFSLLLLLLLFLFIIKEINFVSLFPKGFGNLDCFFWPF
jgi:hypothetical protein